MTHTHEIPIIKRRRAHGNAKPQRFVSLHHHSTFSYLDGYQLPEAHVRRITELNMNAMALTEHGNIDSHTRFEADALKAGIKPIFGCEIYTNTSTEPSQRKFHLTLIAKNQIGYVNLVELITQSWKDSYYEPTVTWKNLVSHRQGLIVLSGCQGSLLSCSTVGGKGIEESEASYKRGLGVARIFAKTFGVNYFIEVQAFPELDATNAFNKLAPQIAHAVGSRLVATMDCHYTELVESEVQQILHNMRPGNKETLEDQARRWGYNAPLCPPASDRSIYRRLCQTGLSKSEAIEAIVSTEEIAQSCIVTLPRLPMVTFPLPQEFTSSTDYWKHLLKEGWKFRKFHTLPVTERTRAKSQLASEMNLIESKGFVDYFLLVQAGVRYIKDLGYAVGPARGSAAASVAAYLLRITEVNPMKFPLLRFERFINENRKDLPDIDLDFPDLARPLLRQFYERMLGSDCVNNVGTFTFFRNRNSLADVARVFHIPTWETAPLKDALIDRMPGDQRSTHTIEDTVEMFPAAAKVMEAHPELHFAERLEGNVKGFGVHAAALILSNEPITNITNTAQREVPAGSGNMVQVIGLDKKDAEYRGLLKMDFLSLNTMSMIDAIIKSSHVDMSLDDLYNLPLDDEATYAAFQANDVVGIFQFDGDATKNICGVIKPKVFSDLMACNALSRPGPLHGGTTASYLATVQGREQSSLHPALDSITHETLGEIVYDEQFLAILREIGKFTPAEVEDMRRLFHDKQGAFAVGQKREVFMQGSQTVTPEMSLETAEKIWSRVLTGGGYVFNGAHAASYSLIGYWCQYFKQHYTEAFFAQALTHTVGTDQVKQRNLLRDAHSPSSNFIRNSVAIRSTHIKYSTENWKIGNGWIRAGFSQIPGVGEKIAETILAARTPQWSKWSDLLQVKGIGPKTAEKFSAFAASPDPFEIFKTERDIKKLRDEIQAGNFALPLPTHTTADITNTTRDVVWVGLLLEKKSRDIFEHHLKRTGTALDPETVKDPQLRESATLSAEDTTGRVALSIDRYRYPKLKAGVTGARVGKDLILIRGKRAPFADSTRIMINEMWVIQP